MKIKNRVVIDSLPSTSTYIRDNLETMASGTLVLAKEQTSGLGQRGRTWQSVKGKDLTFSFYLKTETKQVMHLLMGVSVALCMTLKEKGLDAFIKLPNDIYVSNKKIAGILIETIHKEDTVHSIVGVGLNVNASEDALISKQATSILVQTQEVQSVEAVLESFIQHVNRYLTDAFVFDVFEAHIPFDRHGVCYQNKTVDLVGIDPHFMCHIKDSFSEEVVPCQKLTFTWV